MGEAAYKDAEAKGELLEQRLESRARSPYHSHKGQATLDMEAAHIIRWLSRERDSLIDEVGRLTTALRNAHAKIHGHAWELDRIKGELRGEADACWSAQYRNAETPESVDSPICSETEKE